MASAPTRRIATIETSELPGNWDTFVAARGRAGFRAASAWMRVLESGLGHRPFYVRAEAEGRVTGVLPLMFVESRLFGRFLVSLPYVNSAGVIADDEFTAAALIDHAVSLADRLGVRHLELRHELPVAHGSLTAEVTGKVHMRLLLPATAGDLWTALKAKVRNQVRKGLDNDRLTACWGAEDLLDEFYDVFCRNMRDLGTPPYARRLFARILAEFPETAEVCVMRLKDEPVAAALLVHGPESSEVPSASSLRRFNGTCANMRMYWHLLERALLRGRRMFDFGRSTLGGGTYHFKKQWGARPEPATWQHHVRHGSARDLRPEHARYRMAIRIWKRLPVAVTRWIGPQIVRGIP